jgi:hypothetical protein
MTSSQYAVAVSAPADPSPRLSSSCPETQNRRSAGWLPAVLGCAPVGIRTPNLLIRRLGRAVWGGESRGFHACRAPVRQFAFGPWGSAIAAGVAVGWSVASRRARPPDRPCRRRTQPYRRTRRGSVGQRGSAESFHRAPRCPGERERKRPSRHRKVVTLAQPNWAWMAMRSPRSTVPLGETVVPPPVAPLVRTRSGEAAERLPTSTSPPRR